MTSDWGWSHVFTAFIVALAIVGVAVALFITITRVTESNDRRSAQIGVARARVCEGMDDRSLRVLCLQAASK